MFNMKDLLAQAQGFQSKLASMQEELAEKTVIGSSGGDMVRVEITGTMDIVSVKIENEIIDVEEKDLLESLIAAAVNDATNKSKEVATQEMSKLTGGLKIPGLF
mgnify:CR=1 FL=1